LEQTLVSLSGSPPIVVTAAFNEKLSLESSISVWSTVSLKPSGEMSYSGVAALLLKLIFTDRESDL
jgi:hypothetical protein